MFLMLEIDEKKKPAGVAGSLLRINVLMIKVQIPGFVFRFPAYVVPEFPEAG